MEDNYNDYHKYDDNTGSSAGSGTDYSYENYSASRNSAQDSEYSGGGGYYQYNSSGNSYYKDDAEEPAHSYYASDNSGAGSGPAPRKKHNGKALLVVVLALIFGLCAGAGVWGVHRYLNSSAIAAETDGEPSAQQEETQEPPEEKPAQEEAPAASEPAQEEADNRAQAETPAAETPAVETPAQEESTSVQEDTLANEAGLIISNSDSSGRETPITRVADNVKPSIVSVYNSYTEQVNFFGQVYSQEAEATGSGIIIGKTDTKLLIVTNQHVVSGAEQLRVLFIDEESCEAEIIGTDTANDLAVISVNLADMKQSTLGEIKVATLGNSDNVKVGEQAIAIGNALGYGLSVTNGIVSATEREISSDQGITGTFIQTDAAINPGNSGGALVNADGEVIGINSSKIGGNAIEGMGFAIPISRALPIIQELISQDSREKVDEDKQGTIGISGQSVTSDVASAYNMPQGVYVFQILENGGAANSDLQVGDVITAINGVKITTMEELQRQLQYYEAGTTVTLTVQRQDRTRTYQEVSVDVTLGTRQSIENAREQNDQSGAQQGGGNPNSAPQEKNESNGRDGFSFPFGY